MTPALIDWQKADWGNPATCVHVGSSDDLGKHGRHSDETSEQ